MSTAEDCVVFTGDELLPESWRGLATPGPVRTFNPALLRDGDGWIFAYRIVAGDGVRRIGIGRLDHGFSLVPGSASPLTDLVRFRPAADLPDDARQWFADPRLYRFGRRLFVYWNSGWHEPRNCQFIQELDPVSLQPRGFARELQLRGARQKLEKNWTLFEEPLGGRTLAIYSIAPHRVLEFSLEGDGDVACDEVHRTDWEILGYPGCHGGLRGGAPPWLADGLFWSIGHTVHDGADGYEYLPAAYSFAAQPPFAPVAGPVRPLAIGGRSGFRRRHERLNPAVGGVIYPCGAARDGTRWFISHGINDECAAISWMEHADLVATLAPVRVAAG